MSFQACSSFAQLQQQVSNHLLCDLGCAGDRSIFRFSKWYLPCSGNRWLAALAPCCFGLALSQVHARQLCNRGSMYHPPLSDSACCRKNSSICSCSSSRSSMERFVLCVAPSDFVSVARAQCLQGSRAGKRASEYATLLAEWQAQPLTGICWGADACACRLQNRIASCCAAVSSLVCNCAAALAPTSCLAACSEVAKLKTVKYPEHPLCDLQGRRRSRSAACLGHSLQLAEAADCCSCTSIQPASVRTQRGCSDGQVQLPSAGERAREPEAIQAGGLPPAIQA